MKQREMEENFADLGSIIDAVEKKDMDKARQLAEAHVSAVQPLHGKPGDLHPCPNKRIQTHPILDGAGGE
jgi:hypothetical protein